MPSPLRATVKTTGTPNWNSPTTEQLARRACFDCHSYQTEWPWYGHIAPVSWVMWYDITEGAPTLRGARVRPLAHQLYAARRILEARDAGRDDAFDTDRIRTSAATFQAGEVPDVPVVELRV